MLAFHLSNILWLHHALKTKLLIHKMGKLLSIRLMANFLGLAVDKDNKTVFKDPGKSWAKPDMDVNGNNPTGWLQ